MTPGLTPDDQDLIRAAFGKVSKRIVLNILQKIEAGGIPTEREMEILNSATGKPAPAPPAPDQAPAPMTPVLNLESPDSPTGQAGIAALYEVNVKKVKRWFAAGRQVQPPDPPPVHDPFAMREWHERMRDRGIFKQQPGTRYDAAISKVTAPAQVPVAPAAGETGQAAALPDLASLSINLDDFDPSSIDFDDGVAAARMNFKIQVALMIEAFKNPDETKRRTARAAFKEALDMLREVERDREKIMATSGRLMKREVIRREMMSLHSAIGERFRSRLEASLEEMPTAIQSRETWAAFCKRLVGEICRQLVETKFATEDSQAQAA
jgi:hypothetical protein